MSRIVQEKFEVRPEQKPEGTEGGAWIIGNNSARDRHNLQTRSQATGKFESQAGDLYNSLPPGMDIDDQEVANIRGLPMAGGLGSGTQETEDVTGESLRRGFDRKQLSPVDDMYTREHNDAFYDTIEMDGVEGFVERNNYLDRL